MRAKAAYAHHIPDRFSDVQAAPLLCAGAVGYRSLRLTGLLDFAYTGFARWRLRRRCDETSCATDELAARTDTNRP
jgi:hypothetical protein